MHIVAVIQENHRVQQDLARAARDLSLRLSTVEWSELWATISTEHESIPSFAGADAALLWSMKSGSFEQIVFRMDLMQRLGAVNLPMVNPPRAIEIGVDKYLSLSLLRAAGLTIPQTVICQKYSDAMSAFDELGGDVVVKPLFGSQGFGITRITDRVLAQRAFNQLVKMQSVIYVQRFVPHGGSDLRLFVLGDRVLTAMRRRGVDWRTNIALGGRGEAFEPDPLLREMALRAARACEALVAGVDILIGDDGENYVLEVNPIPGWKELAAVTGIDITRELLQFVVEYACTGACVP